MATPLTWDSPGFVWDAPGVFWDGNEPTPKKMSNIKAIVDFTGYTAADLGPVAMSIHDNMVTAAATFPTPPITMAALQTLINTFNTRLAAKASKATADIMAFNITRHELEAALSDIGTYVNLRADGDGALVESSGVPFYDTARTPDTAPPAAPGNVRLRHGDLSASVIARYRPDRQRSMNEVQTCTGDPNVPANWTHAGMFSGGKATLAGLTPGTTLWVRIRTAGLRGVMGAWSDPAKIMVV